MIKEIVTYPDARIRHASADIRTFDEDLVEIIENMKETMHKHSLNALSAIQIAMPASIVVILQDDGSYLELINPRIIGKSGTTIEQEQTLYYENLSAQVTRYDKIKLIYQDRFGAQHSLDIDGVMSRLIQRKIDYNYGSTFIDRLSKEERKRVEKALEYGLVESSSGSCPTVFYRDYFIRAIKALLLIVFLALFSPLFADSSLLETVYTATKYLTLTTVGLIIGYYFYADYEVKKYKSCTSCQSANTLANALIYFVASMLLMLGSYFIIDPF